MRLLLPDKNYNNLYPLYTITKNNILISKTGEVTVGMELYLPTLYCCSEPLYDEINNLYAQAIRLLPSNTIIHKQDLFMYDTYKAPVSKDKSYLGSAHSNHFNGRKYLTHKSYLFITKSSKDRVNAYSLTSLLTRSSIVLNKVKEQELYEFLNCVNSFIEMLCASADIKLRKLTQEDYNDNQERIGILTQYANLSTTERGKQTVELTPGYYKVGDKKVISHTITDIEQLPPQLTTATKVDLLSTSASSIYMSLGAQLTYKLPIEHIVNQYIIIPDQKKAQAELEQKSRYLRSMAQTSRQNELNSTYIVEALDNIITNNELIVKTHINILSWSSNSDEENCNKNIISSAIAQMGITPVYNTFDTPVLYWGGIPGNAADIGIESYFTTTLSTAVALTSFDGDSKQMDCNTTIYTDRITGCPINIDMGEYAHIDLSLIENYNKFIIGPSGSGKSFTTNDYVRQSYDMGGHILIIDQGNSYKSLCKVINEVTNGADGLYYTYVNTNDLSFNPFYSKTKNYHTEKITFMRSLLCTLWKGADGVITPAETAIINETIAQFITKIISSNSILTFDDYYVFLEDYFSGFGVREKDFDKQNMLLVLKQYTSDGAYPQLLNCKEPVDLLSKRFIVFEVDNIKNDKILFPIVVSLMIDTFMDKMINIPEKKTMLIEEAWKAIANRQMSEYILELWKTARKHCAEAIVVTQEIDDIISSEIVKEAIIANSAVKILMDMRSYKNKFDRISDILSLSKDDIAQILSINRNNHPQRRYKEAYISLASTWQNVYAIEVSPQEAWVYNTDKHKKIELEQQIDKCDGSIIRAIDYLTQN